MRRRVRLRRSTRGSAVDRRQDQEYFRADAGAEEEAKKLKQLREEEIRDANAVAETEELANPEGEPDAHRHQQAKGNCFAYRNPRSFSNPDAEKLAVTVVEIGQKEEKLADTVAEPGSFAVSRSHAQPLARGERGGEPVTRRQSVAVGVSVSGREEGAIGRRDDRA